MNKHIDDFFKRMEENEIRNIDIVKTKGEDIMSRLYEILRQDEHLCDEDILYFPDKWNVTSEEYQALFESMMDYAEEKDFYCDEDNPFSNESVYYKYKSSVIELFTMSGQGTVTSFSVVSEEDIKEKGIDKIISFTAFIDSKKNH